MSNSVPLDTRFAATDLVHLFFRLVDEGRAAETADLFTADGSITFGPGAPVPGTVSGEAIRGAMTARQAQTHVTTRHVLSNLSVEREGDDGMVVRSLLTLFRSDDESRVSTVASVADVTDRLRRDGENWKIASRLVSPVFNRS
ncbi:nuclear transport factor 2 family protein [Novosphingobium sp. 9U]|uniref:nuclear transport factor 2 family protein n=1 Tax=Novosphingobium sp. 9U TaxID=2653158 RepID=UPI0012F34B75|nr:nuclear transport factor 2 family protein [Novosphingobium sp. 9U]VWX50054.1 conserved hypothetical protein [Novosphingobium sp. 9U]